MKDKIDGVTFDEFLDRRISEMQGQLSKTTDREERSYWIGRINAFQSIEIVWLGKPDWEVATLQNSL